MIVTKGFGDRCLIITRGLGISFWIKAYIYLTSYIRTSVVMTSLLALKEYVLESMIKKIKNLASIISVSKGIRLDSKIDLSKQIGSFIIKTKTLISKIILPKE